jgi:uncharacterized protein (TIGR02453 family)
MPFEGFPREGLRFLTQLERNNDRDWFAAHRDEYERFLLEPARAFVDAMGERFDAFARGVHADARVNQSIRRINRDTRFSKDKRPFKTHLDLWFWQGEGRSQDRPGFWFRLSPKRLVLGAGKHGFEGEHLERYRGAVGPELVRAVEAVEAAGAEVGGKHYKRLPAGYEAEGREAELLLHSGLYAGRELPVPSEAHTAAFPDFCAAEYRKLAPLVEWLARACT